MTAAELLAILETAPPVVQGTVVRIIRRVAEGFEGEIHLTIARGGVRAAKWITTETGETLREGLG